MRVLGVDPGLIRLGLGALEYSEQNTSLITYGLISNPRGEEKGNDFGKSGVQQIAHDFPRLLDLVQPHVIVAELVPPGRLGSNSDSVMAALTTCYLYAGQFGIRGESLAANTVKATVTGNHKATKTQIRNTMMGHFDIIKARHVELKAEQKKEGEKPNGLPFDVTDALAVAWTFIEKEKQNIDADNKEVSA